jgi:hypothetical protein
MKRLPRDYYFTAENAEVAENFFAFSALKDLPPRTPSFFSALSATSAVKDFAVSAVKFRVLCDSLAVYRNDAKEPQNQEIIK